MKERVTDLEYGSECPHCEEIIHLQEQERTSSSAILKQIEVNEGLREENEEQKKVIKGHLQAHLVMGKEIDRLREKLCKCDIRIKLVGDGCEYCNPELAQKIKEDNE